LIEFPHNDHPDEVYASMRPAHVFANLSDEQYHDLVTALHQQWRVATRAVMVLLSANGMPAADIGACCTTTRARYAGGSPATTWMV
jgi:hypothetical protein